MRPKLKFSTFFGLYNKNADWFFLNKDWVVILDSVINCQKNGLYNNYIETRFGPIDKIRYRLWLDRKERKERKDEKERSEKKLVEVLREMQWSDAND